MFGHSSSSQISQLCIDAHGDSESVSEGLSELVSQSACSCQQYEHACIRTYHPPLLQGSWIPVQDRIDHRDRLVGAPGRHPLCWSYLG